MVLRRPLRASQQHYYHYTFTHSSLCCSVRGYLHRTWPNYSKQYRMKPAYEEPTMRFFCEGNDGEFRAELRRLLTTLLPPAATNFTQVTHTQHESIIAGGGLNTAQLLRRLLRERLSNGEPIVSYAQLRSSPERLLSFYEILASLSPGLALLAADHMTFTSLLASYAPRDFSLSTPSPTTSTSNREWLSEFDSGRCLGCLAQREFLGEEAALQTEAIYEPEGDRFRLCGAGKFAIVGAATADYAVVTATLVLPSFFTDGVEEGRRSTQCFLVPLRDIVKGHSLRPGITIRALPRDVHPLLSEAGAAVLHFDEVCVPATHLLQPHGLTQKHTDKLRALLTRHTKTHTNNNNGSGSGDVLRWSNEMSALELLQRRSQLASIALYFGTLKRLLTNITSCVATRHVVGCEDDQACQRTQPLLGVQAMQTALAPRVASAYVCLAAWQRLREPLTRLELADDEVAQPEGVVYKELSALHIAGLLYTLQEEIFALHDLAHRLLGLQSVLPCTFTCDEAIALVHSRQIHNTSILFVTSSSLCNRDDRDGLIRHVALQAVERNLGTTHWGWKVTNTIRLGSTLGRLLRNPFYSPTLADLNRHYLFYGHAYYAIRRVLRKVYRIDRQHALTDEQKARKESWYSWNAFYLRPLRHCGLALTRLYLIESMQVAAQRCTDFRARKLLRDLGWLFVIACQAEALDFFLLMRLLSPRQGQAVLTQLDNLATVIAPQCVNLVDSMQLARQGRNACATRKEKAWDLYWSIPGTNIDTLSESKEASEQGDSVIMAAETEGSGESDDPLTRAQAAQRHKAAEAAVTERDESDVDLFHGLADEPSYFTRK